MDTDETLARRLADDLDGSFEAVVLAHQDRLYTIAHRFLGNGHDAEEVAQDALIRAYRALAGYDADRIRQLRLRPWLATIVLNLCRNRIARSATRGTMSLDRESPDGGPLREPVAIASTVAMQAVVSDTELPPPGRGVSPEPHPPRR